ncbi:MAG: alanyl-tRNA editing protein, partial [Lachnospiraceae bacterium]|nr:alanyl-tRNA editing protein [Lachnospiraceae bacterium]
MIEFPETIKLFDENAYAQEFDAAVLSAEYDQAYDGLKDNRDHKDHKDHKGHRDSKGSRILKVILDRTLFFPEEGGQTPDTGEINGFPVIDVQLDGNVIRHMVRIPGQEGTKEAKKAEEAEKNEETGMPEEAGKDLIPFQPGQTVHGRIDFAHRFSNMQNHSGEHILSGLTHNRFGYDNVGFHLSDNTVTLDFNGPLSDDDILWLEQAANRVVWDDLEIRGWYPDPDELEKIEYRSKKEIDGPLRLVEIPGVDMCACCAPHVHRTGEIGLIKIIRTLRERSGIRLTILCGSRALAYMQTLQRAAEDVSHLTNMPREEIAAGVSRILEDNENLKQRGADLEAQVTRALADSVPAAQEHAFLFTDGIGNIAQRRLVNNLCEHHPGYCGVFVGSDETSYRYIIGAGEDAGNTAAGKNADRDSGNSGTDGSGSKNKNTEQRKD